MKRIIITLTLMFSIVSITNAGPFVKFETGPSLNVKNTYFVEGIIGYKLKFWQIESQTYGGWLTWAEYGTTGKPFMEIYSINQKFIYKNIFLRYQHYCAHPVNYDYTNTYNNKEGVYFTKFDPSPYWWYGKTTTISIGFEYELK